MGHKLGQGLEVSVRSSAAASMPGMMDTLLNIGDKAAMMSAIKLFLNHGTIPVPMIIDA